MSDFRSHGSRFGRLGSFAKRLVARALRFITFPRDVFVAELHEELRVQRQMIREMEERLTASSARLAAIGQAQRTFHEANASILHSVAELKTKFDANVDLAGVLARLTDDISRQAADSRNRIVDLARLADDNTRQAADAHNRLVVLARLADDNTRQMADAHNRLEDLARVADDTTRLTTDARNRLEDLAGITDDNTRQMADARNRIEDLARVADDSTRQTDDARNRIEDLARAADIQSTQVADTVLRVLEIGERLNASAAELQSLRSRLLATPYMSEPPENWTPTVRSVPGAFDYMGFEQIFRGPESLIRERQAVYVKLVKGFGPVLDVGCGRGEFMEVLKKARIEAVGIDSNPQMIAYCQAKGLANVQEGDVLAYLESAKPASLGTIFSAQVVEHLAPDDLLRFAHLGLTRLRPGGLFIAETVNSNSIEAAKTFYVDATHVKPLFPETLSFLFRSVGYSTVRVFYPNGRGFDEPEPTSQNEFAIVATV